MGKSKFALILVLLICLSAFAQPKPRIDFDQLIAALPDLPWDFEIRYVVQNGQNTDMLRVHYDGTVDLVRWRPDYPGSLASVCNSSLDESAMRRLLELFRDKKFNDLPTDNRSVVTVANRGEATISVRLGKLIVRKVDRGQQDIAALKDIETALDQIKTTVAADPKSKCEMQSVPAKP